MQRSHRFCTSCSTCPQKYRGASSTPESNQISEIVQKLLMEEAGLTFQDLVYMSRWGAYAPRVAHLASLPVTARRKGSLARDAANRKVGEPTQSTRYPPPLHPHAHTFNECLPAGFAVLPLSRALMQIHIMPASLVSWHWPPQPKEFLRADIENISWMTLNLALEYSKRQMIDWKDKEEIERGGARPHPPTHAHKEGLQLRDVARRGGFLFGCCTPIMMKVKEARGEKHLPEPTAPDANVVDGGDVDPDPTTKV